ncbi:hypothetical protein PMAYCL1PPCAC_11371, partial [Pristionchus mayeri]
CKTARQSPYDRSARSPALQTARQPAYGTVTAREARSPANLRTALPGENNVMTAREQRTPNRSCKTAPASPYGTPSRRVDMSTVRTDEMDKIVKLALETPSPAPFM